ncbi:MAG: hypothetical protein R6X29_10240 [Acidimicrobiia bacterium]
MIELTGQGATALVAVVAVAAVIWGASFSLRSALHGPQWALDHLGSVTRALAISAAGSILLLLLVRPVWAGLGILYVVGAVWFLVASLRRSMARWRELGGFEEIGGERRAAVLGRARTLSWVGAGGMALVAAVLWSAGPIYAVPALAAGAVLAVVGVRLGSL